MTIHRPLLTFLFTALCFFVFSPLAAHAHGTGLTLTSTTTDYFVDIDYDTFTVVAGEPGRFDFKLFKDAKRTQPVEFTKVWVRIVRQSNIEEGDTVFSGWIAKATFGSTGFSISLPKSGAYHLIIRYNNEDQEIIDATLPFSVEDDPTKKSLFDRDFLFGSLAGIALGVLILFALKGTILRRR